MAYCKHCGTEIPIDSNICPSCGSPENDFSFKIADIGKMNDKTNDFTKEDIANNKVLALFSYLSWLLLIPLIAAPNSKYARFHINQGLILAIIETVWAVLSTILSKVSNAIFGAVFPILPVIITLPLSLCNLVFLALSIIGIVNAVNGHAKELPVIGKYRIIK